MALPASHQAALLARQLVPLQPAPGLTASQPASPLTRPASKPASPLAQLASKPASPLARPDCKPASPPDWPAIKPASPLAWPASNPASPLARPSSKTISPSSPTANKPASGHLKQYTIAYMVLVVDKLAIKYAPFRNMQDPYPQVDWSALARPTFRDRIGLPRPTPLPIQACSQDPACYQTRDMPFGSTLGFVTNLGNVGMPTIPINGYTFCQETSSWQISASYPGPRKSRGCRGGGRRQPRG